MIIFLALALLLFTNLAHADDEYLELKIGLIDNYQPFSYEENGQPKGIYVEKIIRIGHHFRFQPKFVFLPLQQILKKVKAGKLDGVAGVVYTEDRNRYLNYIIEQPLTKLSVSLYTKYMISNVEGFFLSKPIIGAKIGFNLGSKLDNTLKKSKIELYRFNNMEEALELLTNNRLQAIIHTENEVDLSLKYSDLKLYKSDEILSEESTYLALSKRAHKKILELKKAFDLPVHE